MRAFPRKFHKFQSTTLDFLLIATSSFSQSDKDRKCDIKVIILLYSQKDSNYLGYIPNEQKQFVDCMREVIKQKTAQPTGGVPTMQQQQQPSGMVGPQGQMVTSNQFANTIQGGGAVTMANGKRTNIHE